MLDQMLFNPDNIPVDRPVAFDFETHPGTRNPDLLAFVWRDDNGSLAHAAYDFNNLSPATLSGIVRFVYMAHSLIAHNVIFELSVLQVMGVDTAKIEPKVEDTMAMAFVRDSEQPKGLKALASLVGMSLIEWENAHTLPRSEYQKYNVDDALCCLLLFEKFSAILTDMDLWSAYDLEVESSLCAYEMSVNGVCVDTRSIDTMREEADARIAEAERTMTLVAGKIINFNSSKQIIDLVYNGWGIEPLHLYLTPKGSPGTSMDALAEVGTRDGIPEHVSTFCKAYVVYKVSRKLRDAFLSDKFLAHVRPDGKVHPEFQSMAARTGRFSCKNPNVQQIPAQGDGMEMRRFFVSSPGHTLVCADLSQIELRLIAHLSADAVMCKAFNDTGADFHQETANIMGISRKHGKVINFGIAYGMGPSKLAEDLGISMSQAMKYLNTHKEKFPDLYVLKKRVAAFANHFGYVRTLSGKYRVLEGYRTYGDGSLDRIAFNTLVQGGAADYIKLCMVRARKRFKGSGIKLIMQVHDELVFDCPNDKVEYAVSEVKAIMESSHKFSVPILAEPGVGHSWLEAK